MKNTLVSWHPTTWTNALLTASVNGPASDIGNTDNISVQIKVGAGATGTFVVQGSNIVNNDAVGTGANFYRGPATADWVELIPYDGAGAPISLALTGSAVNLLLNYPMLACRFIRVIYTFTSGTGTANVWINGKSI